MPRCSRCGLTLTLFIDHLKRATHWYCQVCDVQRNDGSES